MKAALLYGPRDIRVEDVSEPRINKGEVLIKPHRVGICGSDLNRYRRGIKISYPLVMGHECCGDIVQLGEGITDLKIGQRIAILPNFGCGNCVHCRMGRENLCPSKVSLGVTVDGCFAEYVKIPARYAWPIADNISDEEGATIEPVAVAVRAVQKMGNLLGRWVMILGAGSIGLFVLQVARSAGAKVVVADIIEERLTSGRKLGADGMINVSQDALEQSIVSLTEGQGIDIVVETAGGAKTFEQAIEMVNAGGKIILLGLPHDATNISSDLIVRKEIEIVGSIIYSHEDFSQAIQLIREGRVTVAPLITHSFSLNDIKEAFDMSDKGQGIKIMIDLTKKTA
jgi:L-iditol 2-dehydrogenase